MTENKEEVDNHFGLTRQDVDNFTDFALNYEPIRFTCAKCGKEFSQGYSTYECDECFFSRFPKKDVECFCKRFLTKIFNLEEIND